MTSGRQLDTAHFGLEKDLIDVVAALKTRGPWHNPNFSAKSEAFQILHSLTLVDGDNVDRSTNRT